MKRTGPPESLVQFKISLFISSYTSVQPAQFSLVQMVQIGILYTIVILLLIFHLVRHIKFQRDSSELYILMVV